MSKTLTNPRVQGKLALSTLSSIKDVMISFDHADEVIVSKMRSQLVENGIRAWLESEDILSGSDIFARIGQAVVDSHIFMFVMSAQSVQSKICQDQLALAYVSNKPIVPIALLPNTELLSLMDNGMRLELAGFDWYSLTEEHLDENCSEIIKGVSMKLDDLKQQEEEKAKNAGVNKPPSKSRRTLNRSISRKMLSSESKLYLEDGNLYWQSAFGSATSVPWNKFKARLLEDFKDDFQNTFGEHDTEWLLAILHRELEIGSDDVVYRDFYIAFCTIDDVLRPLWMRIQDQARESYAMREVFEMDSSVRVKAIENLGKFKSATVIDALSDLLSDKDPNVQAVAIISLARTGANDERTIQRTMKCLKSKDRVVREACCLGLGVMKATEAIDMLVNLWRNDIISNVREAALAALKTIGGDKAEEAIRVTAVLEKEIRQLKTT